MRHIDDKELSSFDQDCGGLRDLPIQHVSFSTVATCLLLMPFLQYIDLVSNLVDCNGFA